MNRRTRRLAAAGVGCVLILSLLAASAGAVTDDDPYRARYQDALRSATSDFERAVLADGEVTRAEYEEAVGRYVSCMADSGIEVGLHEQGGYYTYSFAKTQDVFTTSDRCAEGSTLLVAGLYIAQLTNPGAEDYDELIVACLIRAGLVEASYSAAQLDTDARDGTLPFDDTAPGFDACTADPTRDMAAR